MKTYDKESFVNHMNFVRQKEVGGLVKKIRKAHDSKALKRLVNEEGKTISEAAKELDISESSARALIQQDDKKIIIGIHDAEWILKALISHFDAEKGFKDDLKECLKNK